MGCRRCHDLLVQFGVLVKVKNILINCLEDKRLREREREREAGSNEKKKSKYMFWRYSKTNLYASLIEHYGCL